MFAHSDDIAYCGWDVKYVVKDKLSMITASAMARGLLRGKDLGFRQYLVTSVKNGAGE